MKHLLDKGGALGALIAATAAPCCFPLLAPIGVALGFGALLPFAEYALVWGRGVYGRGDGGERDRFSVASSSRVASPQRRQWTPRDHGPATPLASLCGLCWTSGISGRGGGQSCARP
jgi:hypothetical protein